MMKFSALIAFGLCFSQAYSQGNQANGVYVGELVDVGGAGKAVSGSVYIVDMHRLHIVDFNYDGTGPDAYFYVGMTDGSSSPSSDGVIIPDENGRMHLLGAYTMRSVLLHLPDNIMASDISWLSIWCESVSVNFGSVIFPSSLSIPVPAAIGNFVPVSHGVSSGQVTLLDSRTIHIMNFSYDGSADDAVFYAGTGTAGSNGFMVRDQYNRHMKLEAYANQDITLTLPRHKTVHDITYLTVWDRTTSMALGTVDIPSNPDVPIYANNIGAYYGEYVDAFPANSGHEVSGLVYVVDRYHVRVRFLNFDGTAPDTFFYIGVRGQTPDEPTNDQGIIIPYPGLSTEPLSAFSDADVVLKLPDGIDSWDITWFSLWCRSASVFFGNVYFPHSIYIPMYEVVESGFSKPGATLVHDVRSGKVTFMDERTVTIEMLHYDGAGPDAFFWIGMGTPSGNGWQIPDENGNMVKLPAYTGQNITLTLPEDYTFHDIDYLSIWCRQAGANFGHITMPTDLYLPPYIGMEMMGYDNCEQMNQFFNVGWRVDGARIYFELTGGLEDNGYMAFGFSGSSNSLAMALADVTIATYRDDMPNADDYFITAKAQCSGSAGVCVDSAYSDGMDDIMDVSGFMIGGVTTVRFSRPITSNDPRDTSFTPGQMQSVVWSMGELTAEGIVLKHRQRILATKMIDFGRTPSNQCSQVQPQVVTVVEPWDIPAIKGEGAKMSFTAKIGPSGGDQGYKGITEQASWGIAFYIDGYIIPELYLQRGVEYTFIVEAGDDPNMDARFHPLYITSDAAGGYGQKTQAERAQETIFAGVNSMGNYTAAGRFCEYLEASPAANFDNFEDYMVTLTMTCDMGSSASLTWTPTAATPDLVYYQCYKHKYLGWKINVVDDLMPMPEDSAANSGKVSALLIVLTTLLTIF